MRINIIQGPFLPVPAFRGGAVEKMWFALGPEFAARGHIVTQVSRKCDGLAAAETVNGVNHVRVPGYDRPAKMGASLWLDFWYARRALRAAPDADVTVTNTFWAPVLIKRRHGAAYVDVQRMPKGQMRLYRRAERLRANSSAVAEAIEADAPGSLPRVRVIPNPLPFAARPVDWAAKSKTILFAGRLHPEKGIALLLEAWGLLRRAGSLPGWRLELAGPAKISEGGGGEGWVQDLWSKFDVADAVWLGPVNDPAELNRRYENATVFAYPSLAVKGETFGVAVLEAMAWGAVPVVSGLACFRDFVVDGKNGIFFAHDGAKPAEALAAALVRAAGSESRAMAEAALDVRTTHANATIAEQFLADFEAVRRK